VRLRSLERELGRMVEECCRGRAADCRVIEALADHALCLSPDHGGVSALRPEPGGGRSRR
jgi:hypothetical protein